MKTACIVTRWSSSTTAEFPLSACTACQFFVTLLTSIAATPHGSLKHENAVTGDASSCLMEIQPRCLREIDENHEYRCLKNTRSSAFVMYGPRSKRLPFPFLRIFCTASVLAVK